MVYGVDYNLTLCPLPLQFVFRGRFGVCRKEEGWLAHHITPANRKKISIQEVGDRTCFCIKQLKNLNPVKKFRIKIKNSKHLAFVNLTKNFAWVPPRRPIRPDGPFNTQKMALLMVFSDEYR